MLIAAVILLSLTCTALAGCLIALELGLHRSGARLERLLMEDSTAQLPFPCPNGAVESLFAAVNALLARRQEEKAAYLRQEQALRQQIANVSHDLRTPLTSILGYLQLLERPGLSPERRREYLDIIEGRARTLQTFIASFYDLSRIEGGEWPLERERVDLARILSDQLADAYEQLEGAGLSVSAELESGLPPVWADKSAAVRVFSNLLTNALRHGSGTLTVRLYREGGEVVSSFTNRAESMTEDDTAHVFERFYTARQARDQQSTGLGLAIVKALADRMGCGAFARLENGFFTAGIRWPV